MRSNIKTAHIDWTFYCVHWHRKSSALHYIEIWRTKITKFWRNGNDWKQPYWFLNTNYHSTTLNFAITVRNVWRYQNRNQSRKPQKDRERKRTKGQPRNDIQNTTQKIKKIEKHEPIYNLEWNSGVQEANVGRGWVQLDDISVYLLTCIIIFYWW